MQAFGQFLWPPVPERTLSQRTGGESDNEDDFQHVEQLLDPQAGRGVAEQATTSRSQPPTITLNNLPVTEAGPPRMRLFGQESGSAPMIIDEGASASPTLRVGNADFGSSDQPRRTPSPTARRTPSPTLQRTTSQRGSKRSSPRLSSDRAIHDEGDSRHSTGGKIRLVNIPDFQQESSMEAMRQQLVATHELLQKFQDDMRIMHETANAAKQSAETAEKRAIAAEAALGKERQDVELRLQSFRKEIQAESAKQVHEANKRAEITLKEIRTLEQAARPRNHAEGAIQPMLVDEGEAPPSSIRQHGSDNCQVPPPPRFPHSMQLKEFNGSASSSSVPKPLSFKRPKSTGNSATIPPSNLRFLQSGDSDGDNSTSSEEDEAAPRQKVSDLNGEEMLKLLLKTMGALGSNVSPSRPGRRGRAHPDFKQPAKKAPKERGKQDLMNWLRTHLHLLLDIKKSRDILKFSTEIYSQNTPIQRHMEQWEATKEGEAPAVKPMKINWKNFGGPWNICLCELFVQYCAEHGLEGGHPNDEVKQFVAEYFWDRLARLRRILKKNRPEQNETVQQTSARIKGDHLQGLIFARRNSRRNQKHHDRIDICLENVPENVAEVTTNEQREWKRRYDVVIALGPEGMSSDESDENNANNYLVRRLPWRSDKATQTMMAIDDSKNTTNGYGNIRPGNRPRIRQRRKNAAVSARKVPLGKPRNLYEPEWYGMLTAGKKRALKAKPDLELE